MQGNIELFKFLLIELKLNRNRNKVQQYVTRVTVYSTKPRFTRKFKVS